MITLSQHPFQLKYKCTIERIPHIINANKQIFDNNIISITYIPMKKTDSPTSGPTPSQSSALNQRCKTLSSQSQDSNQWNRAVVGDKNTLMKRSSSSGYQQSDQYFHEFDWATHVQITTKQIPKVAANIIANYIQNIHTAVAFMDYKSWANQLIALLNKQREGFAKIITSCSEIMQAYKQPQNTTKVFIILTDKTLIDNNEMPSCVDLVINSFLYSLPKQTSKFLVFYESRIKRKVFHQQSSKYYGLVFNLFYSQSETDKMTKLLESKDIKSLKLSQSEIGNLSQYFRQQKRQPKVMNSKSLTIPIKQEQQSSPKRSVESTKDGESARWAKHLMIAPMTDDKKIDAVAEIVKTNKDKYRCGIIYTKDTNESQKIYRSISDQFPVKILNYSNDLHSSLQGMQKDQIKIIIIGNGPAWYMRNAKVPKNVDLIINSVVADDSEDLIGRIWKKAQVDEKQVRGVVMNFLSSDVAQSGKERQLIERVAEQYEFQAEELDLNKEDKFDLSDYFCDQLRIQPVQLPTTSAVLVQGRQLVNLGAHNKQENMEQKDWANWSFVQAKVKQQYRLVRCVKYLTANKDKYHCSVIYVPNLDVGKGIVNNIDQNMKDKTSVIKVGQKTNEYLNRLQSRQLKILIINANELPTDWILPSNVDLIINYGLPVSVGELERRIRRQKGAEVSYKGVVANIISYDEEKLLEQFSTKHQIRIDKSYDSVKYQFVNLFGEIRVDKEKKESVLKEDKKQQNKEQQQKREHKQMDIEEVNGGTEQKKEHNQMGIKQTSGGNKQIYSVGSSQSQTVSKENENKAKQNTQNCTSNPLENIKQENKHPDQNGETQEQNKDHQEQQLQDSACHGTHIQENEDLADKTSQNVDARPSNQPSITGHVATWAQENKQDSEKPRMQQHNENNNSMVSGQQVGNKDNQLTEGEQQRIPQQKNTKGASKQLEASEVKNKGDIESKDQIEGSNNQVGISSAPHKDKNDINGYQNAKKEQENAITAILSKTLQENNKQVLATINQCVMDGHKQLLSLSQSKIIKEVVSHQNQSMAKLEQHSINYNKNFEAIITKQQVTTAECRQITAEVRTSKSQITSVLEEAQQQIVAKILSHQTQNTSTLLKNNSKALDALQELKTKQLQLEVYVSNGIPQKIDIAKQNIQRSVTRMSQENAAAMKKIQTLENGNSNILGKLQANQSTILSKLSQQSKSISNSISSQTNTLQKTLTAHQNELNQKRTKLTEDQKYQITQLSKKIESKVRTQTEIKLQDKYAQLDGQYQRNLLQLKQLKQKQVMAVKMNTQLLQTKRSLKQEKERGDKLEKECIKLAQFKANHERNIDTVNSNYLMKEKECKELNGKLMQQQSTNKQLRDQVQKLSNEMIQAKMEIAGICKLYKEIKPTKSSPTISKTIKGHNVIANIAQQQMFKHQSIFEEVWTSTISQLIKQYISPGKKAMDSLKPALYRIYKMNTSKYQYLSQKQECRQLKQALETGYRGLEKNNVLVFLKQGINKILTQSDNAKVYVLEQKRYSQQLEKSFTQLTAKSLNTFQKGEECSIPTILDSNKKESAINGSIKELCQNINKFKKFSDEKLRKANKEVEDLKTANEIQMKIITNLQASKKAAQQKSAELQTSLNESEKQNKQLKLTLANVRKELTDKTNELTTKQTNYLQTISQLNQSIGNKTNQCNKLRSDLDAERKLRSDAVFRVQQDLLNQRARARETVEQLRKQYNQLDSKYKKYCIDAEDRFKKQEREWKLQLQTQKKQLQNELNKQKNIQIQKIMAKNRQQIKQKEAETIKIKEQFQQKTNKFQQTASAKLKQIFGEQIDISVQNYAEGLKKISDIFNDRLNKILFLPESKMYHEMNGPRKAFVYNSIDRVVPKKKILATKTLFTVYSKNDSWTQWRQKVLDKPNILVMITLINGQQIGGFSQNPYSETEKRSSGSGFLMSITDKKCYDAKPMYAGKVARVHDYAFIFGNNELVVWNSMKVSLIMDKQGMHFATKGDKIIDFIKEDVDEINFEQIEFHQIIFEK